MTQPPISAFLVRPAQTIREAIRTIDRAAKGIALVVDEQGRLVGTVTDGDVRRALLDGISTEERVALLLQRKAESPYPAPITAPAGTPPTLLLQQMQAQSIRQIPLLDETGRPVELATLDALLPQQFLALQAVVMAGGFGTRLRPLTEELPKPMLPVGDRPLLERILNRLQQAGIQQVNITTHYMPEKITDYFGDGSDFGLSIRYVSEAQPLGTAGALSLIETPDEPLLVLNGDILTSLDFGAMLAFHREHRADLTVAVRQYDLQVPYGVLLCEGAEVRQIREKPTYSFFVNAGIYLLQPEAHRYIPGGQRFDMPELIERLIEEGRRVVSFPIVEYWLDIGHPDDYARAQADLEEGRVGS